MIYICAAVILVLALIVGGIMLYGKHQMGRISELSFEETLEYTTKNYSGAVITVGIVKDGEVSYKVYGENNKELPSELHTYEIGSLTKTFTAALINKALQEGKIRIDSTIDNYLSLSSENQYPTIKELLTHTSGYKGFYMESPTVSNFFKGRNDFYGVTKEMILGSAGKRSKNKAGYKFRYSNYGYAVLGLVLEAVYKTDYTSLLNAFLQNELGLTATQISDKSGDLGNYWDWKADDAYLSAGAITSNISDMLLYAKGCLEGNKYFAKCHNSLLSINASSEMYRTMGINMDEIGMAWLIDSKNGIVWHNGGTGNYNSYLGFNPRSGVAVVVLSNLAPNYRIPATVLGLKLLLELSNEK